MAEIKTVARPYAKAIFELARDQQTFDEWSSVLALACTVVEDEGFHGMMHSPVVSPDQLAGLVIEICGEHAGQKQQNFIRLLAENGRLHCLPAIAHEFVAMRDEYENIADVDITSAVPLSEEQKQHFATAMKNRLGKDVRLNCDIDASLIGGAIVRSGDVVIDGSLRGRLDRLAGAVTH
ncbi:MAG: F0F1 ATP synthase subunit delta [Gammaproteobacteria bacterium]|jgi:F-type H+-transporting ATPase subunit delta|nr:MAG: F0F1 ATP synthase subunit delta [Gammaproteobacteria bacterium]